MYKTFGAYREPVYQVVGQHLRGVFPVGTGLIVDGFASPRILVEIDVEAMVQESLEVSGIGVHAAMLTTACPRMHEKWGKVMTFALVGMCRQTGMFGAAVTTSSMGVGSRCPFARAGVGAVLTQHRTDPQLGPQGLELLAAGQSASQVITALVQDNPTIGWRQLAVIDTHGDTAYYHGAKIQSLHEAAQGNAVCAIGNIIRNADVPHAMVEAFARAPDAHLAERLLQALEAGLAAGGELKQVKSAALLVVHAQSFPLVDLRVELNAQPLVELRYLWELYQPQVALYVRRALDPDSVPYPET